MGILFSFVCVVVARQYRTAISLVYDFNLAFALIRIVWITLGLFGMYRNLQHFRHTVNKEVISSCALRRIAPTRSSRRRRRNG